MVDLGRLSLLTDLKLVLILSMNLKKRTRFEHGSGSFDRSLITRNLKHINPLLIEDGELVSWEYNYHKTSYHDSVPVHCGAFILTTSKLHVLKVYFTKCLYR